MDLRAGISVQPGFRGPLRLRALLKRHRGAVVRQDGSLMRASTGCAVGSEADALVKSSALRGAGTMVPRDYREVRKTIVSVCLPVAGNVWIENNAVV